MIFSNLICHPSFLELNCCVTGWYLMTDGGDGCNLICHLSALKNVGKRLLCNAYGLCNSRLSSIYVFLLQRLV